MSVSVEQSADLCRQAAAVASRAYAPYSRFPVGAALLTATGKIFAGVNVENGSYGLTICAERVAVGNAISQGPLRIAAVAVATINGVTPCGACRQVLHEFAIDDCQVLIADLSGNLLWQTTLARLLPDSFNAPPSDATP